MLDEGIITRVVARVKALLPADWLGRAGKEFRAGTELFSDFVEENRLRPEDIVRDGTALSRRAVEGIASEKHALATNSYAQADKAKAEAIKVFTDLEDKKIDIELKTRSLETELRKKEADVDKAKAEARKANAEAQLAEIKVAEAQYDLMRKFESIGLVIHRDSHGDLIVLPSAKANFLPPTDDEKRLKSQGV